MCARLHEDLVDVVDMGPQDGHEGLDLRRREVAVGGQTGVDATKRADSMTSVTYKCSVIYKKCDILANQEMNDCRYLEKKCLGQAFFDVCLIAIGS